MYIGSSQSERPSFSRRRSLFDFDPLADYADETTLDTRNSAAGDGDCEQLRTVVEAVIVAGPAAGWVPLLRSRGPAVRPMKWGDVALFVTRGRGSESVAVRTGLAGQVIVVTDPMHLVRGVDLLSAERGSTPPISLMTLLRAPRCLPSAHPAVVFATTLHEALVHDTASTSGIGRLAEDVAALEAGDVVSGSFRGTVHTDIVARTLAPLKGSLTKTAKLASKATTLIVPLLDSEHPGHPRLHPADEGSVYRFAAPDRFLAKRSLDAVAGRRLVVDRGHNDIINQTANLRELAEIYASDPYSVDNERAREALMRLTRKGTAAPGGSAKGYVRPGDDVESVQLQLADVAAGWARTIIEETGYAALVDTFRLVIYNGRPMTADVARVVDAEREQHRRLFLRAS